MKTIRKKTTGYKEEGLKEDILQPLNKPLKDIAVGLGAEVSENDNTTCELLSKISETIAILNRPYPTDFTYMEDDIVDIELTESDFVRGEVSDNVLNLDANKINGKYIRVVCDLAKLPLPSSNAYTFELYIEGEFTLPTDILIKYVGCPENRHIIHNIYCKNSTLLCASYDDEEGGAYQIGSGPSLLGFNVNTYGVGANVQLYYCFGREIPFVYKINPDNI